MDSEHVKRRVLILYFSGAGASKKIATWCSQAMAGNDSETEAELFFMDDESRTYGIDLGCYNGLIVGTPVYHGAPASVVTGFIEALTPAAEPIPAFIYNTRATWSCNTNRILAKQLAAKGILTVMDRDYRSPASDGSLIVPFVGRFFEFEPDIKEKVEKDCSLFIDLLNAENGSRDLLDRSYIPRFRLSSITNSLNKWAGQLITFRIHLHQNRCSKCGKCVKNCPRSARLRNNDGYPLWLKMKCENCYRCIHHCPRKALSLSKRRPPSKQLQYAINDDNNLS